MRGSFAVFLLSVFFLRTSNIGIEISYYISLNPVRAMRFIFSPEYLFFKCNIDLMVAQ